MNKRKFMLIALTVAAVGCSTSNDVAAKKAPAAPQIDSPATANRGADANKAGANLVSYAQVKEVLTKSCTAPCHSTHGGIEPNFESQKAATAYAEHISVVLANGTMPPPATKAKLSTTNRSLLSGWAANINKHQVNSDVSNDDDQSQPRPSKTKQHGTTSSDTPRGGNRHPQNATSTASATATSTQTDSVVSPNDGASSDAVEFHIAAGTGKNPWNDAAHPINAKVGQELHIYNDDSTDHWIHTNGAPFFHPLSGIPPGQMHSYKVTQPYSGGPLHDHLTYGLIYLKAQ